jgi:RNA polymerase sigma-70 factor, ECF subfamily
MITDSVASMPPILNDRPEAVGAESLSRVPVESQLPKHRLGCSSRLDCTDEFLLAEVLGGSREALAILFRRHRRSVMNVAGRILKDASEAEDLCQEVFLLIFQKANLFNPAKGAASSWIIQIAYSRALNRRQYLTTRQHYVARELNEEQIENVRDPLFVDNIMARSLLTSLREQLSEEQRRTLELHFFDGYSLREIAEKTGQELGNIRHQFYRGLERLRSNVFPQKDI